MKYNNKPLISLIIILLISAVNLFSQRVNDEHFFNLKTAIPGYGAKKMSNTALFQGNKKKKNYFEGWYFKMVAQDGESKISIIPGVSFSKKGNDNHAFIQIIDGKSRETYYKRFHINDFQFSDTRFAVQVGDNFFSKDSIILNIQDDSLSLLGKVYMTNQADLSPNKEKNKKIMGIFRFTPFMQCYHGVVSLKNDLEGIITLNGKSHHFHQGFGYIEKDWGSSMPSAWIWMQTNSFQSKNTSFMLSIANIPWMGSHFTGFLGFFLHNNEVHRFGTYNNSKLTIDTISQNEVSIILKSKRQTYYILAKQNGSGSLIAPTNGSMDRHISEGIEASLSLKITNNKNKIIFHDSTTIAGLEIIGNMLKLKQ